MKRSQVVGMTLLGACWAIGAALSVETAQACACCTSAGQRNVNVSKLDSSKAAQLDQIVFEKAAELYLGEADLGSVVGITTPSQHYDLAVTRQKDRIVFAFRDKEGRSGTLVLAWPSSISLFEVDPRDEKVEGGLGPGLYKEWKVTAKAAGTGIFTPGLGGNQRITLVIHGRGNSCTDAGDFRAWTLIVHGPKAEYKLIGTLQRTQ